MRLSKPKLNVAMARKIYTTRKLADAAGLSEYTVQRARAGCSMRPETVGMIARALGVKVEDILDDQP